MNYFIFDLDETLYKLKDNKIIDSISSTLLQELKKKGKIIIFSNATYTHCIYWCNILNIKNEIDVIITSDSINGFKPNPNIYKKLISIIGITDNDSVYFFEDSYINLFTASQFGWITILINNKNIISDFNDILSFNLNYNYDNVNTGINQIIDNIDKKIN